MDRRIFLTTVLGAAASALVVPTSPILSIAHYKFPVSMQVFDKSLNWYRAFLPRLAKSFDLELFNLEGRTLFEVRKNGLPTNEVVAYFTKVCTANEAALINERLLRKVSLCELV